MREIKVGIFVLLGIISLLILTFQVNSLDNFNKKGYTLYAILSDASGLNKKAKVKLRGVNIGNVESLELIDRGVKLKLFIKEGVKVPKNSVVTLSQDNFLGGRFLKIIPSNSYDYYNENEIITNHLDVASMDDVMSNINSAVDGLKVLISKLNNTLDDKAVINIKDTISNIKDSSVILKSVLESTNKKLPLLLDNANELVLEYKKAGTILNSELPILLNKTQTLITKFNKTGDILNNKLPSILNKTDTLVAKFNKTGDVLNSKLDKLMNEYIKVGENVNELLYDNKYGIKEAIKGANEFFVSGADSFKKIDNYLSSVQKSQILVDIESNYMIDDDYFKTSALISYLPNPTKYYIFGVTSTKEYSDLTKIDKNKNKILVTAEYGKRFDNLLIRGGIIESTGGVGVDYFLDKDRVKLSGDIYDFNAINDVRGNNPHLTLKARYLYLKHIQFIGGVDNILNQDARKFFLGVGVSFRDNDLKTIIGGGASSFLK